MTRVTVFRITAWAVLLAVLMLLAGPVRGGDETCYPIPVTEFSPSGVAGCTLEGPTDGVASWYPGHHAAAQWCEWPWDDCGYAEVQSHRTGVVITVPIRMFCDCLWFSDRRLIDLTESQVRALGHEPSEGLIAVTVTPSKVQRISSLPNTAMPR